MTSLFEGAVFRGDSAHERARVSVPLVADDTDPVVRLRRRHGEITARLSAQAAEEPDAPPQWGTHLAEQAQDTQQWQNRAAARQILLLEMSEIEHALRRADAGAYGRCEGCGREIPPRRLQSVPAAIYCVACQQRCETGGRLQ